MTNVNKTSKICSALMLNKTPAYYAENLSGIVVGFIAFTLGYKYYVSLKFLSSEKFADKVLDIAIALFGFLLVILTLIIQSSSPSVVKMKESNLYNRLIGFNKKVILLTAIVAFLSFVDIFLSDLFCLHKMLWVLRYMQSIILGVFVWSLVDTFIYVRLFYKIIKE